MLASEAGEQMKALYSYKEIDMILDKYGFIIEEHLDESDMTYRYFREYNQANPMHQMSAPVGVGYCICCKKIRQAQIQKYYRNCISIMGYCKGEMQL